MNTISLDTELVNQVLQESLDTASDAFRAAWTAKGYDVDPREHYITSGYKLFVLAFARYFIWTRFPGSEDYAISKPREELYKKAMEMLKNPYLQTDKVKWDDPELSAYGDIF